MKFTFEFLRAKKPPAIVRSKGVTGGDLIQSVHVLPGDAHLIRKIQGRIMRMYDAALTTNLSSDFPVSLTSANAEILTSFLAVRSRARKHERDNPYGNAIVRTLMKNIGGAEPFRYESNVGKFDDAGKFIKDKKANRILEQWWAKAGLPENCTVRRNMSRQELYLQAIAATVRDGGVLGRHHPAFPNNDLGYAIEALEIDRLDLNYQRPNVGNDNEIQFGIEMDSYKAPLYYHIWTRHPGDILPFSNEPRWRERVPAKDIVALFDIRTRAEQMIQVSRFSSIIHRLHREEQFDVAHVTAALMNCCKSIWITKQFPSAPDFVPDKIRTFIENQLGEEGAGGGPGEAGGQGARQINVQPGEMNELRWGQDIKQLEGHFPVEAAKDFIKGQLRGAAAGSGVPYYEIGQDLESVTFSSGRLGREDFKEECKITQVHIILNYVRPHFCAALKNALLFGKIDLPMSRYQEFVDGAKFYGRRWEYLNPLQDAQADILKIEAGLDSRSHVISESDRGGDVEEVDTEQENDREIDKAHNLDFSAGDVTKPSVEKGLPGADVPNPLAAKEGANTPPVVPQGKTPMKAKRVNWSRVERTLELAMRTEPDDPQAKEDYEAFVAFKAQRNGKMQKH